MTDAVAIDYKDNSTFSAEAGFYHPKMRRASGDIVPSSDELLHDFLYGTEWGRQSTNELSVLRAASRERSGVVTRGRGYPAGRGYK